MLFYSSSMIIIILYFIILNFVSFSLNFIKYTIFWNRSSFIINKILFKLITKCFNAFFFIIVVDELSLKIRSSCVNTPFLHFYCSPITFLTLQFLLNEFVTLNYYIKIRIWIKILDYKYLNSISYVYSIFHFNCDYSFRMFLLNKEYY